MGRSQSILGASAAAAIKELRKAAVVQERQRVANESSAARIQSREDRLARIEGMESDAESQTDDLQDLYGEIDTLLAYTLEVDDFFDLELMRQKVSHPAFSSTHLEKKVAPSPLPIPSEPVLSLPGYIKTIARILGEKYRTGATQKQMQKFAVRQAAWSEVVSELEGKNKNTLLEFRKSESEREKLLASDVKSYETNCLEHEMSVQKENAELDQVIAGLPLGKKKAVEAYLKIVLNKSEYPDGLEPEVSVQFDEISRELSLDIDVVSPELIPDVASYRFQKSTDKIVEKKQALKITKFRYENFCSSTVLRTIHEVLEADRGNVIRLISVKASAPNVSSATGKFELVALIEVATTREKFFELNLSSVIPKDALLHLGARVSRNMTLLQPLVAGKSVRRR